MEGIAPNTGLIDLRFAERAETLASCLIETAEGVILVDPGPTVTLPTLLRELAEEGLGPADVSGLLLTHIHLDHAGASGSLVRENPEILVYVHERGAKHLADPSRLLDSANRIYGDAARVWGEVAPVPGECIRALRGGETIPLGGRDFDVAYTPGHAWHHLSYLDRRSGVAFVGDLAGERMPGAMYVIPATPPPDIALPEWRASLDAIRAWRPEKMMLTHFGVFADVERHLAELAARLEAWAERVRSSLESEASDERRARDFAADVGRELDGSLSAEAAAWYRDTSIEDSWHGLARYWRRRSA